MKRKTPPRQAKRRKTDVRHSDKTLSPMNAAGESTMRRVNADDSPDDLEAVVPPQRPSGAGRRSVSRPLFGAKAGAGKSGRDPQTVEERTAALLLERVCQGDLRPERLDPVQVNGTYHCPFCFRAKPDDSAGRHCVPIRRNPKAGKPIMGGGYSKYRRPTGKYYDEWDDPYYQKHLTTSHGFDPISQLPSGSLRFVFQKIGVGRGGNPPINQRSDKGRSTPRIREERQWRLRFGSGFQIAFLKKY